MPSIPIDFSNVESFDNLPLDKYAGSIDKIELRPTTSADKYDQIMVSYLVIDGEFLGRKQSEFLSLSPRAAFRLKKWFDLFGLADSLAALEFDDDTNLLMEPDLVGIDVIFEVYQDPKPYQGEIQIRTRLLSVEEEEAPAPAPKPARRAAAVAAPAPVAEADDEGEAEDDEPEPAPVAAPRRALRAASPVAAAPARRSLR